MSKRIAFIIFAVSLIALAAHAQTASVQGILGSFDVVNSTGQDAHGFEIQIDGAIPTDLYYTGFGQRYGYGTINPNATGVAVRWASTYDAATQSWAKTTVNHVGSPSFSWQDCYMGGAGYPTSGCEALGQGLRYPYSPNLVATGHWLVEDPQNPGTLIWAPGQGVAIPLIVTYTVPTAPAFTAPVVVAVVEAPEPPQVEGQYGDAQWVKVYKNQLTTPVTQADLDSPSLVVPTDAAQLETAWDILQQSPPSGGKQKQKRTNQGSIAPDTRAIVRRYETYKYTGAYDAITHQVQCADLTCTAPQAGELGDFIGAHNSAINITADSLTVTNSGGGNVSDSTGKIKCGSACAMFAPAGTSITLTEASGNLVFTGWGGACSGNATTCTVTVNGATQVSASFLPQFTLSVGRSNPGTVVATPNGNDRALNCGGTCSAKFTQGTAVTLTAIPPDGKTFASWGGACSGTSTTCTITIAKDTSVQAIFNK